MSPAHVAWVAAFSTASLAAQVAVTVTPIGAVTVRASSPTASATNSLPVAPLAPGLTTLDAQLPANGAAASFQAEVIVGPTLVRCTFGHGCVVPLAGQSASGDLAELRLEYTAATPTPVRLLVDHADQTPAGAPQPRADVDIGDDGTFEFVNGVAQGPQNVLTIGPQPLVVRVVLEAGLAQVGATFHDLSLRVVPENLLQVSYAAIGCSPFAAVVEPLFVASGVRVQSNVPTATPKVFVFGLSVQPIFLPPVGGQPCLLLPSVDVPLFVGSFGAVDVPLPAAVRPVSFWVQPVELDFSGELRTWTCQRVDAN